MTEIIEFESSHEYSLDKPGISINVTLSRAERSVELEANIDTGSTYCIFERHFADRLDLEVETGFKVVIGTATGTFNAFGHEVTMTFLGFEAISTIYFAESEYFDRNVLGRIGFLDRLKSGVIEPEAKLFLSRYQR